MKKLFGVSLITLFAVCTMKASAADPVYPETTDPGATTADAPVAAHAPRYALAQSAATDGNVVSAGYVKGAYNAAIRAVNTVHDEAASKIAKSSIVNTLNSTSEDTVPSVKATYDAINAATSAAKDGANLTDKSVTKAKLETSVQSALDKANTALQSHQTIETGSKNGTISVAGSDVAVKGLGTAAYANANSFDAAGAATAAAASAASGVENKLGYGNSGYDIDAKTLKVNGASVATQSGVVATVNSATVSYDIMNTWGSDSATSATYDVSVDAYHGS